MVDIVLGKETWYTSKEEMLVENRDYAVAYKLGKIKKYDKPKILTEIGINYFPQSLAYLD